MSDAGSDTGGDAALVGCVTRLEIDYLARLKDFMKVDSYDALAVVLFIADRKEVSDRRLLFVFYHVLNV